MHKALALLLLVVSLFAGCATLTPEGARYMADYMQRERAIEAQKNRNYNIYWYNR